MPTQLRTPPAAVAAQHLAPESARARASRLMPKLLAAATAVLLWLSFFPANLGFLAWVALVPLLILTRAQMSTRAAAFTAWLIGLPLYWASLQWVRVAHPMMVY